MKTGFINCCLAIFSTVILLISCSSSRELRRMNREINGKWVLQTIITEGASGKPKDKVFNEADFSCFIGSGWKFNKNKYNGSYSIIDRQKICPNITRPIRWSLKENASAPAAFTFMWSADNKQGAPVYPAYNLIVLDLKSTSMKLKQDIMIDGQPAVLIFNFVKQ